MMFKAGDRVHHIGRKEDGTVLPFDTAGVVKVKFDHPTPRGADSIGQFDELWFKNYPGWLVPAADKHEIKDAPSSEPGEA